MPQIDLRDFVVRRSGAWTEAERLANTFQPQRLWLAWPNDEVEIAGPVSLRMTFHASNVAVARDETQRFISHVVYDYGFTVPAGFTWSYRLRQEPEIRGLLGNNGTYGLAIEPGLPEVPVATIPAGADIPCDIAVANIPNFGEFFPSACEPCPPGAYIGLPPGAKPTLAIPPAAGGCVRPHFFNGMFITREDMETLVRYVRSKTQVDRRASGHGVKWGLNVGRSGNKVVVQPGYAVDCCGHDVVLTTTYAVDIATLLKDPAAFPLLAKGGAQRLHLLVEYLECPEDPRPVHGDPCTPQTGRCEMSRIRETLRLRLVPPRDFKPDGPIGDFIKEIEALRRDPQLRDLISVPHVSPAPVEATAEPRTTAPYVFEATAVRDDWHAIQPITTGAVETTFGNSIGPGDPIPGPPRRQLRLRALEGMLLLSGTVTDTKDNVVARIQAPTQQIFWPVTDDQLEGGEIGGGGGFGGEGVFKAADLRVGPLFADSENPQFVSSPSLELTVFDNPVGGGVILSTRLVVPAIDLVAEVPQLAPYPCFGEACDPEGKPLFPVFPPWLHADPVRPGEAFDWKVLVLAVVYGWMASELARHRSGTPQQVITGRLTVAAFLYQAILTALFNSSSPEVHRRLTETLQRLLCAWCQGFLYPGPRCGGEPHGVVIGCARVEAGNISSIDPWGGRRYVVHYPLLAHWSTQLGIAPPDLVVSRVLNIVCCIAGLPVSEFPIFGRDRPDIGAGGVVVGPSFAGGRAQPVGVGSAFLVIDDGSEAARAAEARLNVVRREPLDTFAFVNRAIAGLSEPPAPPGARFVRYELRGSPNVALLAPEPRPAVAPAPVPEDRLREMVRSISAASRRAVPPLLTDFADELTMELMRAAPLEGLEESPLRDRLRAARIGSVGAFFSRPLADIHEEVCAREDPKALTALARANEELAGRIQRAVVEVLEKFGEEKDVVSPEQLADQRNLNEFTERLVASIKRRAKLDALEPVAGAAVAGVVRRLSGGGR